MTAVKMRDKLLTDIATRDVETVPADCRVGDAAHRMAERRISSIVVADERHCPIGIITERDILREMHEMRAPDTAVSDVMTSPVVTVGPTLTMLEAYQLCLRKGIRHLVIVDAQGRIEGLLSETDFRMHMNLATLAGLRSVVSVMHRAALSMAPDDSLSDALALMRTHRDSYVIVVEAAKPVGIVTERDVVRFYSQGTDQGTTRLGAVMASPVLTVGVDETINEAAKRMLSHRVRHLVVVYRNGELAGLISEHDLAQTMAIGLLDDKVATDGTFLRTLLDTLPFLVWLKDEDGTYIACNSRFEDFFGAAEYEIVGRNDYDFVPKDLADAYRAGDRRAIEQNTAHSSEEWRRFARGGYHGLFETIKTPMHGRDGKLIGVLGISRDITEHRQAVESLRVTASVFDTSQEAIMITDADNRIADVNPAFCRITGYTREEVIGRDPRLLSSSQHDAAFYQAMWAALETDRQWRGEIWNRRKNGELYAELLSITVICDEQGRVQRYVGVFSDISSLKEHEAELQRVANYDMLTGLPNRRLLADRLNQAIYQAQRSERMLAVCYLDLDGFKQINDQHGHEAGDTFLIAVTRRLAENVRAGDTLARLGGDEFVVLINELADERECLHILQRLLDNLAMPIEVGGGEVAISASIGVAFYRPDIDNGDMLLRQADQAMYAAKQSGKNRYHLYDTNHDQRLRQLRDGRRRIRQGMERQEFEIHYQPVVELASGRCIGAEALLRWHHAERGLLPPASFLPDIAGTELDIRLGYWVIEHVLLQLEQWQRNGLMLPISVNVSSHLLQSKDFVSEFERLLQRHPALPPKTLRLEVLETGAMEDIDQTAGVIESCRGIDVGFAIDDFGSGYSSLMFLRELPADTLKIDQLFVRNMLTDDGDRAIVEGIIGLAKAFGRTPIAVGVETLPHAAALLALGCRYGQGFAFAPPLAAEAFCEWYLAHSKQTEPTVD